MQIKLLAGLAALIAAAPVLAQETPPLGYDRAGQRPPLTRATVEKMVTDHFARLDLNHDGVVTKGEIVDAREAMRVAMMKAHRNALFDRLDKNKDGTLSRDEFDAPPPGGPEDDGPPPPPGGPGDHRRDSPHGQMHGPDRMADPTAMLMVGRHWFDRVDADHDGRITLAEAKAAALAAFDRVDTNHDGTISTEERRMAMRAMMARGRQNDGPDRAPPPRD